MQTYALRGIRPPKDGVWERFLACCLTRKVDGLNIVHAVAGRGAAKTYHAMMAFAALAFRPEYRGKRFLWSAPTDKDIKDTFWPNWEEIVPKELWRAKDGHHRIELTTGGPEIVLSGRLATNSNREPNRGPSNMVAVFDEARQDPNPKAWKTLLLGVRGREGAQKIVITTSTPVLGSWYQSVVEGSRDPVFYATTFDNPIADVAAVERAAQDLSPEEYQREVLGRWVPLGGRAWENADLETEWPDGNIHPHTWTRSMPFSLSVDIGAQSSWIIWQHPVIYDDYGRPKGALDVAVAEFTPNHGNTEQITKQIEDDFGVPMQIYVGPDVNTGAYQSDGRSAALTFRSIGWDSNISWPVHPYDKKSQQYIATNRCILNQGGHRQMCVSAGLRTYYPNHRGIREVLLQDTWSEKAISGQFLPKDKVTKGGNALEDTRDAMMYGMSLMHPLQAHKQIGAATIRQEYRTHA